MTAANFIPSAKPIAVGKQNADNCLVLIHGLTLSGRQFMPIGEFLLSNLGQDWQIILPTAPVQNVTNLAWWSAFNGLV